MSPRSRRRRRACFLFALAGALVAAAVSGCGTAPSSGGSSLAGVGRATSAERLAVFEARALEDPADPTWPFRIAETRAADGDVAGAEAALRGSLALDSGHAPSLALLSKLWWEAGRHDEAIALLESRRANAGGLPDELTVSLALHYEAIGRTDLSDGIVDSVESRLSSWDTAGAAVTYLRLKGDGFRRSAETADRALAARPGSAVNQNNWGIARLYLGDPVEARKAFLTAIEIDPDLPGPFYNLAIVDKFYRFDDAGAREWFRRYLALADEDPDGLAEALSVEISADTSSTAPAESRNPEGGLQ